MKKFYKENRVFVILMGIALVCIAVIIAMMVSYIVNSSTKDKYGNRLDGIGDVEITEQKVAEMENSILEMNKVQDVIINIHGKIVNFNIDFQEDSTVDEAQNVSISCLEFFEEDFLNFYDIQFLITAGGIKDDKDEEESTGEEEVEDDEANSFPMIGYRKAGSTTITWSNNAKK